MSWVAVYSFWFAVWIFHSVPAARACAALGSFILLPAKWFFERMGGDQTTMFFDPTSYFGTNGLVLGIVFYSVFRGFWTRHEARKAAESVPAPPPRAEAKVG